MSRSAVRRFVSLVRAISGGMLQHAVPGKHDLYRLIEVDATGNVRDERVHS